MEKKEFNLNFNLISIAYRAVCHSKNNHWKGVWRQSYHEAFEDGDKHRYENQGNQFHEIKIEEKKYSEANIE